jgi:hypothetical protein
MEAEDGKGWATRSIAGLNRRWLLDMLEGIDEALLPDLEPAHAEFRH